MKGVLKFGTFIGCIIGVAAIFYLILHFTLPTNQELEHSSVVKTKVEKRRNQRQNLKITAIGDSLTFGVGATKKQGGYVPLLQTELENKQHLKVTTHNYGKTGDRSDQIKKRILASKDIQKNLNQAEVITLTVGGNDLMKVLQKNFTTLAEDKLNKSMPKAKAEYKATLTALLAVIRQYNQTAPIFLISVYNPFYVYFPMLDQIQQFTDEWNEVAQETIKNDTKIYFVDVNKQLSEGQYYGKSKKGLKKEATTDLNAISSQKLERLLSDDTEKNDYLSKEDHFHPNDKGYQYMATSVYQVMLKHKNTWLEGAK